jgi:hypothetical protein
MNGTELLLTAGTITAARWAWHCWFHPFTQCRSCRGSKVNGGSTRRRYGMCRRCGGSGQRQVLGSRQVHRAVRSLVSWRRSR